MKKGTESLEGLRRWGWIWEGYEERCESECDQNTVHEILKKLIQVLCFYHPATSRTGVSRLILDVVTNMTSEL